MTMNNPTTPMSSTFFGVASQDLTKFLPGAATFSAVQPNPAGGSIVTAFDGHSNQFCIIQPNLGIGSPTNPLLMWCGNAVTQTYSNLLALDDLKNATGMQFGWINGTSVLFVEGFSIYGTATIRMYAFSLGLDMPIEMAQNRPQYNAQDLAVYNSFPTATGYMTINQASLPTDKSLIIQRQFLNVKIASTQATTNWDRAHNITCTGAGGQLLSMRQLSTTNDFVGLILGVAGGNETLGVLHIDSAWKQCQWKPVTSWPAASGAPSNLTNCVYNEATTYSFDPIAKTFALFVTYQCTNGNLNVLAQLDPLTLKIAAHVAGDDLLMDPGWAVVYY